MNRVKQYNSLMKKISEESLQQKPIKGLRLNRLFAIVFAVLVVLIALHILPS
jgi:hypothetical protein